MTTDAAEEVKVSETSEEEKTEANSEESTEEQSQQGEEQEQAQTEESAQLDPDEHVKAFLDEQGLSEDTQEESNESEKSSFTREEMEAELQRRTTDLQGQQQTEAYRRGVRESYEKRPSVIRATLSQYKVDPQVTEWVVQQFSEHNGQVQQVAEEDARTGLTNTYNQTLLAAAEKHVKGISGKQFNSSDELMAAVVEGARTGRLTEKEAKQRAANAVLAYKKDAEAKKLLSTAKAPPKGGGENSASGRSPDDVLDDPDATEAEKDAAFEKKHGFKP